MREDDTRDGDARAWGRDARAWDGDARAWGRDARAWAGTLRHGVGSSGMGRGRSGMDEDEDEDGSGFLNQFQGSQGLYDSRLVVASTTITIMIITKINMR
jgi:hypothetical protein